MLFFFFFFSSRRRHTRYIGDWSSDVCSSDLHIPPPLLEQLAIGGRLVIPLGDLSTQELVIEIGRASCRERSVDLGGRRVTKKKKKQKEGMWDASMNGRVQRP